MKTLFRIIVRVLALALGLFAGAVVIANRRLDRQVEQEILDMFDNAREPEPRVLSEADIQGLPEPVQRWLRHSQVVGKEKAWVVRLKQSGTFRMAENQPWAPIEAEQYYTVNPPGFIWRATLKPIPVLPIRGRDMYRDGEGNMLIKVLGLFPVVDARGPELNQGTLMRYLSEMPWFPSAAVSDYITWEPVGDNSAKATMTHKGITASAVFFFSEQGALVNMVGKRYRMVGGDYSLDTWETPGGNEREFQGVRIGSKGEATWKLSTGDLPYAKLELTEVEYNNPSLY